MEVNKIEYEIGIYDLEGHFIDSTDNWECLLSEFNLSKENVRIGIIKNSVIFDKFQLRLKEKNKISSVLPLAIGNVTDLSNVGDKEKPVAKYYKDKLICVYKSVSEASKNTYISQGSISQSCISGFKSNVFNFKYIQ